MGLTGKTIENVPGWFTYGANCAVKTTLQRIIVSNMLYCGRAGLNFLNTVELIESDGDNAYLN
jgi:hypothetical protein